jgi:hypothetical protein
VLDTLCARRVMPSVRRLLSVGKINLLGMKRRRPKVTASRNVYGEKEYQELLEQAAHDGEMREELYEYELEEMLDELKCVYGARQK